ncbi:uncharacterized protein LOC124888076 [Capsicum annuum]|uniref:uncharacterized protein LOC124888076 n=1 Tax=Capsicum annuum TaxID=4072 RepID=UPI001FB186CA|nr:uncharacterized protein LOC124888076 [Capsicum annuum]
MKIKLVFGGFTLHVCSVYVLQMGLKEEVKARFWEDLDEVVRSVPSAEKIVIARDFNGHIGILPRGYDDVYGGFGFGVRNGKGAALLDFARAFELIWKRVVKRRLKRVVPVSENQFRFMLGRSTTEAIHLVRRLVEQYR